jgi:hypothetical protein
MVRRAALLGIMLAAGACTDQVLINDMVDGGGWTWPGGKDAAWPPAGDAACGLIYPPLNNYRSRTAQVVILFDRSGPMQTSFVGSKTRADAAEDALLAAMYDYQARIMFGFAQFPADSTDKTYADCQRGYCCAGQIDIKPAYNAYKSISKPLQCADPISFPCPLPSYDSPSNAGLTQVKEFYGKEPNAWDDDRYVLLVTASEPSCSTSDGSDACSNAVNATVDMGNMGISVVVLSVGYQPGDGSCLVRIRDAGSSLTPPDGTDNLYSPSSWNGLENAVEQFVSAVARTGCTIELTDLPPSGAQLWVSVGGVRVEMDDQNGWSYVYLDHTSIKLSGWACDSYVRSQSNRPINIGYNACL